MAKAPSLNGDHARSSRVSLVTGSSRARRHARRQYVQAFLVGLAVGLATVCLVLLVQWGWPG